MNNPFLKQSCYVGGQWIASRSGATFAVTDPASGALIGTVPDCGAEETQAAIVAATRALPDWRARTADERSNLMMRLHDRMLESLDALAELLVYENGKPLAEAKGEIRYGASFIRWFAEEGRRVYGETIPASAANKRIVVTREPIGVCAMITPWNFPNAMLARKLAAALAAGCTLVAKPAEETPLSALAIAALCEQAGIPAGVVNVVTAARPEAVGAVLTGTPVVRKLSFTGSSEVGELLMRQCSSTLKRLSLELGGSAPLIVFEDADLAKATEGAMASKYRNCGQTCVASNRFLVHESIADRFAVELPLSLLATHPTLHVVVSVGNAFGGLAPAGMRVSVLKATKTGHVQPQRPTSLQRRVLVLAPHYCWAQCHMHHRCWTSLCSQRLL